jgi:hypothetical protein
MSFLFENSLMEISFNCIRFGLHWKVTALSIDHVFYMVDLISETAVKNKMLMLSFQIWISHSFTVTNSVEKSYCSKFIVVQVIRKFSAFNGTQIFITLFTTAPHWTLYWVHISARYLKVLIKVLCAFLISPTRATCPVHLTVHYLLSLIIFGHEFKLWSSSLFILLEPPVTSFHKDVYLA